jgi:hypothetical protein
MLRASPVPDGRDLSRGHLWPRWVFLRALGLIFLSAFLSLAAQVHGLVGERGILPAGPYLDQVRVAVGGLQRYWLAPTLFWLGAGDRALTVGVAAGVVASLLLVANLWPRASVAACTVLFLSFVGVLQVFSSYQSDGMLLEAGFLSVFLAPPGARPGLGAADPPSRLSRFALQWEWFRIYFESGVVKLASGDPHWRDLTAMDEYYQNGPLPTWIGWYVQQLPHGFHAATVVFTLLVELVVVWAVFLPRRFRIGCFAVVSALQVGIIATANYAFLNYLVLSLGVLLLDDAVLARAGLTVPEVAPSGLLRWGVARKRVAAGVIGLALYATVAAFLGGALPSLLAAPERLLGPFRIANAYGLFAVMTPARYEIEFQGTLDGRHWVAYPFRFKPQDPGEAPGIYAPYQPRFDWNLWFASLERPEASPWVLQVQARLLEGSPGVLHLFRRDPLQGRRPEKVRTVLWQYWFTDPATKRATGAWWRRSLLGPFTLPLARIPGGGFILQAPR